MYLTSRSTYIDRYLITMEDSMQIRWAPFRAALSCRKLTLLGAVVSFQMQKLLLQLGLLMLQTADNQHQCFYVTTNSPPHHPNPFAIFYHPSSSRNIFYYHEDVSEKRGSLRRHLRARCPRCTSAFMPRRRYGCLCDG